MANPDTVRRVVDDPKASGAMKRSSMDLTRALADLPLPK